jgi:peptidoglycan/LPS O-acetylase OafA/YrhL
VGVLRLVLALSVVASHAGDYWPTALSGVGGSVAVEIFFAMPGFYMALVLSRTYAGRMRAFFIESRLTDLSRVLASCSRTKPCTTGVYFLG